MDFIVYAVYLRSDGVQRLKYSIVLDMIDGKYVPGMGVNSSGDGVVRKRPESSSPEKLKARNKEKYEQI